MISKIIQKEKARQEEWLRIRGCVSHEEEHKESLVNLKEYIESKIEFIDELLDKLPKVRFSDDENMWDTRNITVLGEKNQLFEDMEELTKMIERYD